MVVPFKARERKSRLSPLADESERRELAFLMLLDVLDAVDSAGLVRSCWVVSSDRSALSIAEKRGARPLAEPRDEGVNAAVRFALRRLPRGGSVLVLPADLPFLESADIEGAMRLGAAGFKVVIAPSKGFDGTNLLMFPNGAGFKLSYDAVSFSHHVTEAGKRGLCLAVTATAGLASDLDTPEDLRRASRAMINSRSAPSLKRLGKKRAS